MLQGRCLLPLDNVFLMNKYESYNNIIQWMASQFFKSGNTKREFYAVVNVAYIQLIWDISTLDKLRINFQQIFRHFVDFGPHDCSWLLNQYEQEECLQLGKSPSEVILSLDCVICQPFF